MKHFRAITEQPLPTTYLHDMTGHVLASRRNGGAWIAEAIASEFGCHVDDVRTDETEECEFITVNGERVAYVSLG